MPNRPNLLQELIDHKVLYPSGVDGVYGRSGVFEDIVYRFEQLALAAGKDETTEAVYFPPGMSRAAFEKTGYLENFPHLAGTVHSFCGNEHDHATLIGKLQNGEDWADGQQVTDVVMTPAACYPIYPIIGNRGPLPEGGVTVALSSYCFRHEPSPDPARMQMFRQREFVRIGTPGEVVDFQKLWMERGQKLASELMLPAEVEVANDPFFGRVGQVMASSQRDQALKFELLIPIVSAEKPTACISFNYHQDHFGEVCNIVCSDGSQAHTACVGFGLERLTLALFRHHGFDVAKWPARTRKALWG
jgi:seryl-tRNA synthetase